MRTRLLGAPSTLSMGVTTTSSGRTGRAAASAELTVSFVLDETGSAGAGAGTGAAAGGGGGLRMDASAADMDRGRGHDQ